MGRGTKRNEPRNDRDDGGGNDGDEQPRYILICKLVAQPRPPKSSGSFGTPVPAPGRSLDEGEDLPLSNVFALS